ncbi:septum formation initiator family protein [Dactylosporangium sp. CA-092794]|uniref:septum formation initiator family protein n=1 Tax=Dactylosporangium sp. CA-092794 TaxID=3239929 RepID=UPI003D8B1669
MQQRTRPGGRGMSPRGAAPRSQRANPRGGAGRAPARPVARRAVTAGGAALRTRAPQPQRFTSRAVLLSFVLLTLLLAYAYPVRVYLAQQAEIEAMEASQQRQEQKVADMKAEAKKYDDPEYIISQARQRLHMMLPGEKAYVVVDPANAEQTDPADLPGAPKPPRPWYSKLWSSVEAADQQ